MTDPQTDWGKTLSNCLLNVIDSNLDNQEKLRAIKKHIKHIDGYVKFELSHQATEILEQVERELMIEEKEHCGSEESCGRQDLKDEQRQALQKIKETYEREAN